jgi:hypothetical protein
MFTRRIKLLLCLAGLIVCLLLIHFGRTLNSDQRLALANSQASSINFIYHSQTNSCFAIFGTSLSFMPCELIPMKLIPNYPKTELKALEDLCRSDEDLSIKSWLKI